MLRKKEDVGGGGGAGKIKLVQHRQVAGSYEHGNKLSVFIKWKFFHTRGNVSFLIRTPFREISEICRPTVKQQTLRGFRKKGLKKVFGSDKVTMQKIT
jgi:hypothetical protein